jgi:outer membrane protein assembly factor BamB
MNIVPWRALALASVGALLLGTPARADWTEYGGSAEHHFFTTEKLTAPLGVVWKYATMAVADKGGNKGGPVIVNGIVYFASKNRVYAVDATTGEQKWRVPEGEGGEAGLPQISATPVAGDEFLYVPDANGTITAYKLDTGDLVWSFRTGSAIRSSPTLTENVLYFGSDDDYVYAIDAKTGDLKWKSNDRGRPSKLSDDAVGSPVYYNGVIYINTSDMKVWALTASDGKIVWEQRMTASSLDVSPVAFNNRVYMAGGSTIYQFRLRGGGYRAFPLQQWVENDISTTPLITERTWYVGDRNGYFQGFTNGGRPAMNAQGEPWKVKLEGRPQGTPIMTADTIYVSTDKGFVYGVDIAKGRVTWTYRMEAPKGIDPLRAYYAIRAPMAVSDGHLYILGDDGTLTCMTSDASDDEGPVLSTPRPSRGAVINGMPPVYLASYLWDEGTGINPDTIEMLLDENPIEPDPRPYNERVIGARKGWVYDPVKRLVSYSTPRAEEGKPEQPLLPGRHKVRVQAADWRGNVSALEWTFVVDNTIPKNAPPPRPRPGAGAGMPGAPGSEGGYPGGPGMTPGGYPGANGAGGAGGYPGAGSGTGRQGGRGGQLGGYQNSNRGGSGYFGSGGGGGGGLSRGGGGGGLNRGGGGGGLNRGGGGGRFGF